MLVIIVAEDDLKDTEIRYTFEKYDASASALLNATIEQGDKYVSVYWESK